MVVIVEFVVIVSVNVVVIVANVGVVIEFPSIRCGCPLPIVVVFGRKKLNAEVHELQFIKEMR